MALTVREKEHWKERIELGIDRAIEELQAAEDPKFYDRVREEAEVMARRSLGIEELHAENEIAEQGLEQLQQRQNVLWRQMYARIKGVKPNSTPDIVDYLRSDVISAVRRRRAIHERELLAKTPIGRKIARLESEREELLDTVWLATSPSQIKELWSRFTELLKWEPPELPEQALPIDPVDGNS